MKVAALFVDGAGCYSTHPAVAELWDETRDARGYRGPFRVVAHPPCERWGRFWHGSPRKPHQYKMGDDAGCFGSTLISVRTWGGVIEHPAYSHAWGWFGLAPPKAQSGWWPADDFGGMTCYVEQGNYGHAGRKPTWLYAYGLGFYPDLIWKHSGQRLHPAALAKHGYAKAMRIGWSAMIGGKDKARLRSATPIPFRNLLVWMAQL